VDHNALAEANPLGGDINLRAAPAMQEYRSIARRIRDDGAQRVLDWGCGAGQVSDLLSKARLDVTAFDYRHGVEDGLWPLEHYPHLSAYLSSDPCRLPFADGSFDAVLSCGVLEHVEDPDASLEEVKRVLVPGGAFYVYKLPNRFSYIEAIARRVGLYYHGACDHDRVYTRVSAIELLRRHEFTVIEIRQMNMLPLTLTGTLASRAARRIWKVNRALSAVPGLNRFATNVEAVARTPAAGAAGSSAATA
jgi:2-polyprenyl-3-methyl-5-hydroxy-6-metoxy-1,4-benzoquinol methylase